MNLSTSTGIASHGIAEHKTKAEHDLKIAQLLLDKGDFLDWVITCSFYSAMHCVDAYAHKCGVTSFKPRLGEKTNAHRKRMRFVNNYLKHLFINYKRLFDRSTQARYDPQYFKLMYPKIPCSAVNDAKSFFSIK